MSIDYDVFIHSTEKKDIDLVIQEHWTNVVVMVTLIIYHSSISRTPV